MIWTISLYPSFDSLNKEFTPSSHIIDIFPSQFLLYPFNKYSNINLNICSYQLNNISITSSLYLSYALIVTDASIKNNIVTSIVYIHVHNKPITKTIHHTVNITSTEAKLFAIRYSINQAVNIPGISKIIVITD